MSEPCWCTGTDSWSTLGTAEHLPDGTCPTGSATCTCGNWSGPFTVTRDERDWGYHVESQRDE